MEKEKSTMIQFVTITIAALIIISSAVNAESLQFSSIDNKARSVIKELPDSFSKKINSLWIKVSENEPPYLFLMPIDKCGAGNCDIVGYQHTHGKWVKVYDVFGGDGIEVLEEKTQRHRNIRQYETRGAGEVIVKISKWNKDKYFQSIISNTTH